LKFVNGRALLKKGNKILAKVYDRAVYYPANNMKSSYPKNEPYSLEMSMGSRGCSSLEEVLSFINKYLSESVISEATKITKKVKDAITKLNDLQKKLAEAQAKIDAIKKEYGFDDLQKQADNILKENLWDFMEQLKKDDVRIVKIKNLIMKINRFQASPATYNYEKVLDYAMTLVNQDVKEKILIELKACEKIGNTKGNVSFTTEGIGDIWNSIKGFFQRLIPALQSKGQKIDNQISDLEKQIQSA